MTAYIKRKSDNEVLHSCSGQSTENDLPYLQELVTKYGYEQNDCIIGDADNSEIQSWITEVTAEKAELAKTYADRRREEYPSIEDVTVALAEKAEGDSTMWDEITLKRQAIKAKYLKE